MSTARERRQISRVIDVLQALNEYVPYNPADTKRLAAVARLAGAILPDVRVALVEAVTGDEQDLVGDYLDACAEEINRQRQTDGSPDRFVFTNVRDA